MRLLLISRRALIAATMALSLIGFQGCSDDDDGDNPVNPGPSTQFTGTFASPNLGGILTITIQSAVPAPARRTGSPGAAREINASAVLMPELGAAVHLAGTYDAETESLVLSGGYYNLRGVYDVTASVITGQYGPNLPWEYSGPPIITESGYFACAVGGPGAVDVYCGVFQDDEFITHGRWNVVIVGDQLRGIGALHSGVFYQFSGTVSGTGSPRVIAVDQDFGGGSTFTADGTLDTNTGEIEGTWTAASYGVPYNTGAWSGGACQTGQQTTELIGTFVVRYFGLPARVSIAGSLLASARPAPMMGAHAVPATAVLGTEALSGFYNPETDSLNLVGLPIQTLAGKYDEAAAVPGMYGRCRLQVGSGLFGCVVGDANTVKVLCGSFENEGQTASGQWNLIVKGSGVVGMAMSNDGQEIRFEGMATGTGTTRSITLSGSDDQGGTLTATGTLDVTTYTISNGTWSIVVDSTPGDSGTWGGELCSGASP